MCNEVFLLDKSCQYGMDFQSLGDSLPLSSWTDEMIRWMTQGLLHMYITLACGALSPCPRADQYENRGWSHTITHPA